jgi:Domain of unknown function (DUF4396)
MLDWMQQHRRRNWSCNRISAWLGHNFDACISGRIGICSGIRTYYKIPMLKTMPLRQAARVTLVGDTASISAMEITENSLVFLIPGYSCTQDYGCDILARSWNNIASSRLCGFSYPAMYWAMKKREQKKGDASASPLTSSLPPILCP